MEFIGVHSIEEALQMLSRYGEDATILAGGTDVMTQLDRREIDTEVLLHIEALDELKKIELGNDRVEIGALATHRELAMMTLPYGDYTSIHSAAVSVGGWQTQAVGTIGGNICNASPAADLVPALLVHGAKVRLHSKKRGVRMLTLEEFLLGRRQTAREADELLTHISVEVLPKRTADVYLKVGRRSAMEVAIVGLALRMTMDEDFELIGDIRIATCATGPISRRARRAEDILKGERWSLERITDSGKALCRAVSPIDDVRGSAAYRMMVLPRLLERAMGQCLEKIQSLS